MADQRIYNHKDIQRYLQQQMSEEEMHGFEKAMMEDPFLADALDGYKVADQKVLSVHLEEINRLIKGEQDDRKAVPIISRTINWIRIAALFILIAGAAIFTFKILNNSAPEKSIATISIPKSITANDTIKADEPTTAFQTPKLSSAKNLAFNKRPSTPPITSTTPSILTAPAPAQEENNAALALSDTKIASDSTSAVSLSAAQPMQRMDVSGLAKRATKLPEIQQEVKGQIVNSKGEPVAGASILAYNNIGTNANANGRFALKSLDSLVDVQVAAVGYMPATATIKSSDTSNKIVLNESREALSEVVIMSRKDAIRSQKKQEGSTDAEPEGGWNNFYRYIDSSLTNSKEKREAAITRGVDLEFLVDSEGKPFQIRALNAENKELQNKAVELLKQGPRWRKKGKNAKAKVTINFK